MKLMDLDNDDRIEEKDFVLNTIENPGRINIYPDKIYIKFKFLTKYDHLHPIQTLL